MKHLGLRLLLCATGVGAMAFAIQPRSLIMEEVHVTDEHGVAIKDLAQNDFAVFEDGTERPIEKWIRSINWFGGATYRIYFRQTATLSTPTRTHSIDVKSEIPSHECRL
jgi:hypothetical protein